jgi:hypothetical protein
MRAYLCRKEGRDLIAMNQVHKKYKLTQGSSGNLRTHSLWDFQATNVTPTSVLIHL